MHLIPAGTAEAVKAQQDLVVAIDDLEEAERRICGKFGKTDAEISDLKLRQSKRTNIRYRSIWTSYSKLLTRENKISRSKKQLRRSAAYFRGDGGKRERHDDETMNKIAEAEAAEVQERFRLTTKVF